MRKIIAFALAAMVLSLSACGSNESTNKTGSSEAVSDSGTIDDVNSGVSSLENITTGKDASTGSQTSEVTDNNESSPSAQSSSHTASSKPANPEKTDCRCYNDV